jgi:hypothetical protein
VPGGNAQPANYRTHIVVYQELAGVDQSALEPYDYLIIGRNAWDELRPDLMGKALLYIDIWAASAYRVPQEELDRGYWQPGPGNLGEPDRQLSFAPGRVIHCYQWDSEHPARFAHWCERALALGALGIFADDWGADRFWWEGPAQTKAALWPGYPRNATVYGLVQEAERRALAAVRRPSGSAGLAVFNGSAVSQPASAVFHEDVGNGKQDWNHLAGFTIERGDTLPADAARFIGDGRLHFLQINGLDASGELTQEGRQNLDRATREALRRPGRISIGLAYAERPAQGGSIYQIPRGAWADPRHWPSYR